MHAYELHQRLTSTEELGLIWHVKQSHLYALLNKLEEAGYVATTLELQGNRPPRKILALTPEGVGAFEEWLQTPVSHGRDFRMDFLAKLYFAAQRSTASAQHLIARQCDACEEKLRELRQQASAIDSTKRYSWLVIQFRISNLEAIMHWLAMCAEHIADAPISE